MEQINVCSNGQIPLNRRGGGRESRIEHLIFFSKLSKDSKVRKAGQVRIVFMFSMVRLSLCSHKPLMVQKPITVS